MDQQNLRENFSYFYVSLHDLCWTAMELHAQSLRDWDLYFHSNLLFCHFCLRIWSDSQTDKDRKR